MIRITSSKYKSRIQNGDNYSLNPLLFNERLDGNVGEVKQWEVEFELAKLYKADLAYYFDIEADSSDWILTSSKFDFESEDVRIGDTFKFYGDVTAGTYTLLFEGVVTYTRNNEFGFTATSGTPTVARYTDNGINFNIDAADVLDYSYGLNANQNYQSNTDDVVQTFTFDGVIGATNLNGVIKSESSAWAFGTPKITEQIAIALPYKRRVFTLIHELVLNPYGTEEVRDLILTNSRPNIFNGLKFNALFDLRRSTMDGVLLSESVIRDAQVGWFDRVFNSSDSPLNVYDVEYLDETTLLPVEAIQTDRETRVKFKTDTSDLTGYVFNFIYSTLPSQSQYQKELITYEKVWQYDNHRATGSSIPNEVIKQVIITTGAINEFEVIIDPTFANSTNVAVTNQYLLALQLWNVASGIATPIHPIVKDTYFLSNDIAGLLTFGDFKVFPHHDNTAAEGNIDGYTSYFGNPQDSIAFRVPFSVFSDVYAAEIRNIRVSVIAVNTSLNEFFEVNGYDVGFANFSTGNGLKYANSDGIIGYDLLPTDPNNEVVLSYVSDTATQVNQLFDGAIRIDWQGWIANADALNIYFDNSLLSQGKGSDAHRYQIAADTELYLQIKIGVYANNVLTDYALRSRINVEQFGYVDAWNTDIKITDLDGVDMGGQFIEGSDSIIETTHTLVIGSIDTSEDYDVIHSFEPSLSSSVYGLIQASTKRGFLNSTIKSITQTKTTSEIVTKTVVDSNQISGEQNIYSRLLTNYPPPPLPLDGLHFAGFSAIRLTNSYTGFAMQIRNNIDPLLATTVYLDVGFDGANADIAAIEAFVGVGNPFYLTRFYNQGTMGGNLNPTFSAARLVGNIVGGFVEWGSSNTDGSGADLNRYNFLDGGAFSGKYPHLIMNQKYTAIGTDPTFIGLVDALRVQNQGGGVRKPLFKSGGITSIANPQLPNTDPEWNVWMMKRRTSDNFGQLIRDNGTTATTYATLVALANWSLAASAYRMLNFNSTGTQWQGYMRDMILFDDTQSDAIETSVNDYLKTYYGY